jgi:hypothetical protein
MENRSIAIMNEFPPNKYNLLIPVITMQEISPLHKIIFNQVKLSSTESDGDAYPQKQSDEDKKLNKPVGYSLTKKALLNLMTAANAIEEESKKILPTSCHRCTEIAQMTKVAPQCGNCKGRTDVAYQVSVLVPDPAGGYRRYVGSKEMSIETYKGKAEHMAAQCETKALLRAVRAGLGIKGTYTATELAKPFVVALVVPNLNDPELKAKVLDRYAGNIAALFGGVPDRVALAAPITQTVVVDSYDIDSRSPIDPEVIIPGGSNNTDEPPWKEDPMENAVWCEDCGSLIEDTAKFTAKQIQEFSKKRYRKTLCLDCQSLQNKAGGR